ncbi:hypothetical protein ACJJTC_006418 [Scirpophaga incertulas]
MQKLIVLFCVAVFAEVAYSAVSILPPQEKPAALADQPGCYVPELNRVVPPNQPYAPVDGNCNEYRCSDNGWTSIVSCGAVAGTAECPVTPGDSSRPYPDCCARPVCNN